MIHNFRHLVQDQAGFGEQLKSLELFSNDRGSSCNNREEKDRLALQNLQYFSTTLPKKLEKIKIKNSYRNLDTTIATLITSNRETLQSLNFGTSCILDSTMVQNMRIPNLKQIHVHRVENNVRLLGFLENQPPLEHLTAHFPHDCPRAFLNYLQNKAESLRTLNISGSFLDKYSDWKFLSNCFKLKNFTIIHKKQSSSEWIKATFFKTLHPLTTKLCLRGLSYSAGSMSVVQFLHSTVFNLVII